MYTVSKNVPPLYNFDTREHILQKYYQ